MPLRGFHRNTVRFQVDGVTVDVATSDSAE